MKFLADFNYKNIMTVFHKKYIFSVLFSKAL
jgi:hypothetical protein